MAALTILRNSLLKSPSLRMAMPGKQGLSRSPISAARIYGPDTSGPAQTSHWKHERIGSAVLVPLIPAAIAYPCPVLDCALSASLVLHTHWGMAEVFKDYIHGQYLPKIISPLLFLSSILALGGLLYLNFNDVGVGQAVRLLYTEL